MSKFSRTSVLGRRSGGTVTVLEAKVHNSWARKAKLAYILTAVAVGLLYAVIFNSSWPHPIISLFAGAFWGVLIGAPAWVVVRIWPVIVRIGWWFWELLAAVALAWAWTQLVNHTPTAVALVVVAAVASVCGLVPPVRRRIAAVYRCFEVRHRLRVAFTAFIITNRQGSLPWIRLAVPTPVGERISIKLWPGLSLADLQSRLDKLAVTCFCKSVTVEPNGDDSSNVHVFTKRRDVLGDTVDSPLPGMVPDTADMTGLPTAPVSPAGPDLTATVRLNLADIPNPPSAAGPAAPKPRAAKQAPPAADNGGVSDWI